MGSKKEKAAQRQSGSLKSERKVPPSVSSKEKILQRLSMDFHASSIGIGIAILICFVFSIALRAEQYKTWKKYEQTYFIGDIPMMSTLDAYAWINTTKDYMEGKYSSEKKNDLVPMLSFVTAKLSSFFGGNIYKASISVVPIFASLFIIPLSFYFFKLGYPSASIIGSFLGTFNFMYYTRTSVGRVDTDLLNLFFPFLASSLIYLMGGSSRKRLFALSALSGFSMFMFYWWYSRPAFSVIYLGVMVLYLWLNRVSKEDILYSSVIFITMSNLYYLKLTLIKLMNSIMVPLLNMPGSKGVLVIMFITVVILTLGYVIYYYRKNIEKRYVVCGCFVLLFLANVAYFRHSMANILKFFSFYLSTPQAGQIQFPSVAQTITEAQRMDILKTLSYVIEQPWMSVAGLVLFLIPAVIQWRKIIPLSPIIALGLLSFGSSQRFVMYLAPFIGVGYGYVLTLLVVSVLDKFNTKKIVKELAIYGISVLFILGVWRQTAISFVPSPSVPVDIYSTFLNLKEQLPKDSSLFTWWDFGFALQDVTRLTTFHDGATQELPKTYFIARGFVSGNQKELYNIISYVNNKGQGGIDEMIRDNQTHTQIINQITQYATPPESPNIYVLFTRDMIGKFSAISYLGNWDFQEKSSPPAGYSFLTCQGMQGGILTCNDAIIDINSGMVNTQTPLKKTFFINNGSISKEIPYNHDKGYYLQLMLKDNRIYEVHLLSESVFNSNFNQMYLLGKIDPGLYEEVYNVFPTARVFKVKK